MSELRIKELVELLHKEMDSKKFQALVTELNEILEKKNRLDLGESEQRDLTDAVDGHS